MRFQSAILGAIPLLVAPVSVDAVALETKIGSYEILAAGNGSPQTPYGELLTVEPFSGKVYFEAHPDVFVNNDTVSVELFSGVNTGAPCSNGTIVPGFTTSYKKTDTTGYNATTSNGEIGVADFSIANIQSTSSYSAGADNTGDVSLCVRSSIKADFDPSVNGTEYVSFIDTHVDLTVDFTAKFANFSEGVNITITTTDTTVDENITKSVDMDAFLCGVNGRNASEKFKMGSDFQVCVRPIAKAAAEGYFVESFPTVMCDNGVTKRYLIANGVPDVLTSIQDNVTTSKSADGEEAGPAAKAFRSTVVASYLAGENVTSFQCSGTVSLKYNPGRRSRHLETTRSISSVSRGLQEGTTTAAAAAPDVSERPFATTIFISTDYDNVGETASWATTVASTNGIGLAVGTTLLSMAWMVV